MANLLAHCLSAIALQSALNPLLRMEFVGESSFLAGIVGMLIHLDYDRHNGGRTPILHSVFFGTLYSLSSFVLLSALHLLGFISLGLFTLLFLIVPSGFWTHLIIDGFTDEGIYTFPDRLSPKYWFRRRLDSENTWSNWSKSSFGNERKNDDPFLNLGVSSISLIALISFLALTPL